MTPTITMDVFAPGGSSPKTSLARSSAKQWLDQLDDTGAGSFDIDLDDADRPNVAMDDIVMCKITGESDYVFSFIIEDVERKKVDPGEEVNQRRTYGGRGRASILDRAIVYPERGATRRGGDTRMFDYTSSSYEETFGGWNNAVIKQHGRHAPGPWSTDFYPDSYPLGLTLGFLGLEGSGSTGGVSLGAKWIWYRDFPTSDPVTGAPIADAYFRADYTIAQQHTYAVLITADNAFEMFIDGVSIGAESFDPADNPALWESVKRYDLTLDAGAHTFAIHAYNGGGPAGVIMALHKTDRAGTDDGEVTFVPRTVPEFVTDDTWRAIGGPNMTPPGMTPGLIIHTLNQEARDRDTLTGPDIVTPAVTATLDTANNTWPVLNIGVQVGATYLDVLRQLAEAGVIWRMAPRYPHDTSLATGNTNVLQMYTTLGTTKNVSYTPGINVDSLTDHTSTQDLANVILGRVQINGVDQLGWMETTNPTSVSVRRRRETFFSAANQEPTFVRTLATKMFEERAVPAVEVSIGAIEPYQPGTVDASKRARPYVDYEVGDWIKAPGVTIGPVTGPYPTPDAPTLYRVRAVSVAEDDDGNTTANPELGTLITERALRLQQWVNTMIPGALGGTTGNASLKG